MKIRGAKILVVGLARSGLAAAALLGERGAAVIACDTRPLDQLPEAAARLEQLGAPFHVQADAPFEQVDGIVLSPGVPADLPRIEAARARGVPVIGEAELAGYYLKGPIVGITGSNGKTTTTALLGHLLTRCGIPCQVGGNIGTPPAAMAGASRYGQWNVLELSSFQLETISSFRAAIGVCINVTPDHLDRHHNFENYARAKRRLFETQTPGGFAILNADDAATAAFADHTEACASWFSQLQPQPQGAWVADGAIWLRGAKLMPVGEVPLRGRHNLENVMAASLAAFLAGATLEGIAGAVRSFPGVEHRLEFVREVSGIAFYNDSKATNVDATLKAIDAFEQPIWIILGGKDKDSDYTVLREPLAKRAKAALLIGAAAGKIRGQLAGALPLIEAGTIDRAIGEAYAGARAGDVILLAPACASFDQFASYEHRGRVYKEMVRALEEKAK